MKQNLVILAMVISMIAFAALGGRSDTSNPEGKVASGVSTAETQIPLVAAVGD